MAERLLVPLDGSPQSDAALEYALAEHPEATLVVLHVVDPLEASYRPGTSIPGSSEDWYERERERAEELFEDARERAGERGVEVETAMEVGRPARTILERANGSAVDGIVMGSHGRSGIARALLGSVAENVVRRSPVPVTVVR